MKTFFDSNHKRPTVSTSTPNFTTLQPIYPASSEVEMGIKNSKVLKPDKTWTPPSGPTHLEAFILANEIDLNNTFVRAPKDHNINRNEKLALQNLKSDHTIMIKPADKGGAIVILNRDDYIKEGKRQLSDPYFYKHLDSDPTDSNNQRINFFINSMKLKGEITWSLERKLLTLEARTPELNLLPKIHKNQNPVPGRPIVSANGCSTEKISALIDIILRPHLPKIISERHHPFPSDIARSI